LIDLNRAPELREPGSSANIIDEARRLDLIVVHPEQARFCTLAGLCTHYPRPLTYLPKRRVLQCNNFNHSTFALDGSIVKGPATKPIAAFPTTRKGRTLVVEL
jgi:Rieske Fe-S protein